jgi:hypothetical protein
MGNGWQPDAIQSAHETHHLLSHWQEALLALMTSGAWHHYLAHLVHKTTKTTMFALSDQYQRWLMCQHCTCINSTYHQCVFLHV